MRKLYCANCGQELKDEAYMFRDNYLQVQYFDDYKSNRFCSEECAMEALFCDRVDIDELPLDDDEESEADDDE